MPPPRVPLGRLQVGLTPLVFACVEGSQPAVELLLERGAMPDLVAFGPGTVEGTTQVIRPSIIHDHCSYRTSPSKWLHTSGAHAAAEL